jgi:hypothetical protein
MDEEIRKKIEERADEILNEDPEQRYERMRRWGVELIARHEVRREQRTRRVKAAPRASLREQAARRALAERLAYSELQEEGKPDWKDALDPETRRRVEERADEILREGRA